MLGISRFDSCRPAFRQLRILTVVSVYIYQLCLLVRLYGCNYRAVNVGHRYNTRNDSLLEFPVHRTSTFEKSPQYMSTRCYNKLSDYIKTLGDSAFKTKLRNLLVDRAYYSLGEFFSDVI